MKTFHVNATSPGTLRPSNQERRDELTERVYQEGDIFSVLTFVNRLVQQRVYV